jgi:TonB family protein
MARRTQEGQSGGVQDQTGQGAVGPASGTPGTGGGTEVEVYKASVETKVKQGWVLPENLSKTNTNLQAIIVIVIGKTGKVQNLRFERKSGNDLFDQSAIRAIKKAEPFRPILNELINEEIGLIFDASKK